MSPGCICIHIGQCIRMDGITLLRVHLEPPALVGGDQALVNLLRVVEGPCVAGEAVSVEEPAAVAVEHVDLEDVGVVVDVVAAVAAVDAVVKLFQKAAVGLRFSSDEEHIFCGVESLNL